MNTTKTPKNKLVLTADDIERLEHNMKIQELAIVSMVRNGEAERRSVTTPPDLDGVQTTVRFWHIKPN